MQGCSLPSDSSHQGLLWGQVLPERRVKVRSRVEGGGGHEGEKSEQFKMTTGATSQHRWVRSLGEGGTRHPGSKQLADLSRLSSPPITSEAELGNTSDFP